MHRNWWGFGLWFVAGSALAVPGPGQEVRPDIWRAAAVRDYRTAPEAGWMTAATAFAQTWERTTAARELQDALRCVPAGEPVANEPAALQTIRGYLAHYQKPAEELARSLSVRPELARLLLREPERIPAEQRATLIRRSVALIEADQHARQMRARGHVVTPVSRLALATARVVRGAQVCGLLSGPAGLGKTRALEHVTAQLPGTLVIRADADSRGSRGILRAIGQAAGVATANQPASVKAGIHAVRSSNRLLIVDEAQLLSLAALEAVRAVFDNTDSGLLLVGTAALTRSIDETIDPLLAPLAARVAVRCNLVAELLRPGPDNRPREWLGMEALGAIVAQAGLALETAALRKLHAVANGWPGYLRTALNAARVARLLAGSRCPAISADHVTAALALGERKAVELCS